MPHLFFILFFFALGACIGSFLNVVVWRLPRGESLISPPSHCPRCGHGLAWYDNIPVFGWLMLRGRCRYCAQPISPRYPTIEFLAGALFAFYYVMFFIYHIGPCAPQKILAGWDLFGRPIYENRMPVSILADWPMYLLCMFLIASLLAVSLIDMDSFFIPLHIPWLMAAVGLFAHVIIDRPNVPGALNLGRDGLAAALSAGGGVGLLISLALWRIGWIPQAFPDGEPALEVDEELFQKEEQAAREENRPLPVRPPVLTAAQIRLEMRKEMLFLLPPLLGAMLAVLAVRYHSGAADAWQGLMDYHWLTGLLGSLLGALIGAFIIWFARIIGTLLMGRVAMGLGDMHLLFGVGAIIGAGPVTVAFFLAPFAGLAIGLYLFLLRRQRELPYGPYLSLGAAATLLVYCPIADYFAPGVQGLLSLLGR